MKELPLSNSILVALVDDDDFDYLSQFKWRRHFKAETVYAKTWTKMVDNERQLLMMHRVVMKITDSKIHIDHIDRNGLNNQKNNLRIASSSTNNQNRRGYGSSQFKGVSWDSIRSKWKVQVGKSYGGLYKTEIEAAQAYDAIALQMYGESALLNFPKKN